MEVNSRRLFTESNIGGHDYLRNMVHLPFYLQNSGLRKVKIAQQTAQHSRKTTWTEAEESVTYTAASTMHHSVSNRRLSTESAIMNSNEKLKPQSRKGSRKLRLSESIASSIGSNLNRLGGAQDLNKMLLTDDYFSDVNPRSMRRLMNVVYVTGNREILRNPFRNTYSAINLTHFLFCSREIIKSIPNRFQLVPLSQLDQHYRAMAIQNFLVDFALRYVRGEFR